MKLSILPMNMIRIAATCFKYCGVVSICIAHLGSMVCIYCARAHKNGQILNYDPSSGQNGVYFPSDHQTIYIHPDDRCKIPRVN